MRRQVAAFGERSRVEVNVGNCASNPAGCFPSLAKMYRLQRLHVFGGVWGCSDMKLDG